MAAALGRINNKDIHMGSILSGIVVALYLSSRWFWPDWSKELDFWDDQGRIAVILHTALTVMFGAFFGMIISMVMGRIFPTVWKRYGTQKLVAISRDTATSGEFFLGIGDLGNKQTLSYAVKNADGSFCFKTEDLDEDTKFFEEDRQDGEIVFFELVFALPVYKLFGLMPGYYRQEFHIPMGSVTHGFKL